MSDGSDQFDSLDEPLRRDLCSLYQSHTVIPSHVNDAILNRAHARLAGMHRTPRMRKLRWAGAAVAAAACVLLFGRVAFRSPFAPEDIDGNRRVDIVDALKLAHQVQSGKGRDLNGDGVIDQRDVETIAVAVVRLDASGGGVQ